MNVIKIRVALVVMRFFKWQNIPKLLARYLQIIITYYDYVGGETLGKGFSEDSLRNALKGVTVVIYLYGGFLGLGAG